MRLLVICTLLSVLIPFSSFSQTYHRRERDVNQLIQELFPVQTEGVDYQTAYENLYQLYASPLDLNTVTRDELLATALLTERQLNSLLSYRSTYGPFLSLYELQAVPDLDLVTIRRLLPFVTVDSGKRLGKGLFRNPTDHYLIVRAEHILERQKGFTAAQADKSGRLPQRYLGGPQQWYLRYRYSSPRNFSLGLTLEQDAGEPFRWRPNTYQYGLDYLSFHAQVQNRGRWYNVLIGDYQLQAGQGLVLASGFFLGKGAETVAGIRRPSLGARPYTSLTEYGYLRGLTATYALDPTMDVTVLVARNRRDANLVPGDTPDETTVSSLQTSGLHRTLSELEDRASLLENNLGAHLLYHDNRRLQLGATFLHTVFDKAIRKRDQAYNRYEFAGTHNTVAGLHGAYVWRNVNLFGETAYSSGGGLGATGGTVASLTKRLDAALLGRYYARNFHSFYANGFGENTRNSNEQGIYLGLRYVLYRKLTAGAFIDRFRFPWLKYGVDKPSSGFDYLFQTTYTPTKKVTLSGIYHEEHKEKNRPAATSKTRETVGTVKRNVVLKGDYTPVRGLTFQSRIQWGSFRYAGQKASNGVALVQDATADFGRLSLSGRVAWFSTDDYDSRQYVYERDVLSAFSIPAYANKGIRNYLLIQYTLSRHLDVWLRWSQARYRDQTTVGSGLDQINQPHKSEVKLQMRWRF